MMLYRLARTPLALILLLLPGLAVTLPALAAEETGHEHHHHEGASTADGEDPHAHHKAMMDKPVEAQKSGNIDLRDRALLDQDGQEVRFVSDVIGDRIVVMDFVYTTCTTVCPVLSAVFAQLQDRLGDELGADVALVSVTVDPVRDTPQRLKAYAATHNARDGWVWLTGPKTTVEDVLTGVGAYSVNFEDHPAMVLVGDGRTGEWSRFFGFPSPDRIMEEVNALQAARQGGVGG
jgi:protein SCO1/2